MAGLEYWLELSQPQRRGRLEFDDQVCGVCISAWTVTPEPVTPPPEGGGLWGGKGLRKAKVGPV